MMRSDDYEADKLYDAKKEDDRMEALLHKFDADQIAAMFEVAEAEYEYDLGYRSVRALDKILEDTANAVAWEHARRERTRVSGENVTRHVRLMKANERWAALRPRP
jgi:hypothetical protein